MRKGVTGSRWITHISRPQAMKGLFMLSSATHLNHESHNFRRKYERKYYNTHIVFSSDGRVYQGSLKDISIGGAFVFSKHTSHLMEGDWVTISIPFTNGRKHVKRSGEVLWKNSTGFAITFYP